MESTLNDDNWGKPTWDKSKWESSLKPPIEKSIQLDPDGLWKMGTMVVCQNITGNQPTDAIATWNDGVSIYCLRPQSAPTCLVESTENKSPIQEHDSTASSYPKPFYQGGDSVSCWAIGSNVICKVASWTDKVSVEANTIAFVKRHAPTIPVPEVIHAWIDEKTNRTYLVMKRVEGRSLRDAWPDLSISQIQKIAVDLIHEVHPLSRRCTSRFLESVDGKGLDCDRLLGTRPFRWPTGTAFAHPRYDGPALREHLRQYSTESHLPWQDDIFFFYHSDLTLDNVFVTLPTNSDTEPTEPKLSAVIDWQSAGYFPYWWIPLAPLLSPWFAMEGGGRGSDAWQDALWAEFGDQDSRELVEFHDKFVNARLRDLFPEWVFNRNRE